MVFIIMDKKAERNYKISPATEQDYEGGVSDLVRTPDRHNRQVNKES